MDVLASTRSGRNHPPGRWVMVPKDLPNAPKRRRERILLRRRRAFERLLVAAVGTLILGLIPHLHLLLYLNLALDLAVVGYVAQLRRWRGRERQRREVVRPLPATDEQQAARAMRARRSS